jgi:predicted nuclease of predicted toxin-antitoxin system
MIKLYLDEDVPEAIAHALRLRGYDALTVKEAGRKGDSDIEQLHYAFLEGRVLLSHNVADFCRIHADFITREDEHNGIILSKQLPIGIIVKALLQLLAELRQHALRNNVIWLSDWMK